MGFQVNRRIYVLDFEGTPLEGLEVKVRGGTLGEVFAARDLMHADPNNPTAEDLNAILGQMEELAGHLVSWNLEDDGVKIPADLEGLKTLELPDVMQIMQAWMKAQVDVPGPLGGSSSSTPPPDLSSIPMEPLVASQAA